jgi:nitrogen fixation protein FixH
MKFHWGHGIAIFFSLFVAVMLTALFMSKKEKVDLVTEDYYAQELVYQDRIDQKRNARNAGMEVKTLNENEYLVIELPELLKNASKVEGNITLYRPSDSAFDVVAPVTLADSARVKIHHSKLQKGNYILKMQLNMDGKEYYLEQNYDY